MPAKREGAITLTFAKRNKDVRKILDDMQAEDENFVATDYICDAIRFYASNNNAQPTDVNTLAKLVEQIIKTPTTKDGEEEAPTIDLERDVDVSMLGDD